MDPGLRRDDGKSRRDRSTFSNVDMVYRLFQVRKLLAA